ncbi:MAG: hypothetical protein ACRDN6_03195 [Gaiellaceae bacterium]
MSVRIATICACTALLAACGGDGGENGSPPAAAPPTPAPAADGTLTVDAFNDYVEAAQPAGAHSPLVLATEFLHVEEREPSPASMTVDMPPEGASEAAVTATFEGLLDDSVRAVRFELVFERADDGTWRLRSAVQTQRCWPGRGHETFSAEDCV